MKWAWAIIAGVEMAGATIACRAKRAAAAMLLLLLLILLTPSSPAAESILSVDDNCTIGNCTLQVEDVDCQAMQVWLAVERKGLPLLARVLSINDTIPCGNRTVLVKGIYAGEHSDLVCLEDIPAVPAAPRKPSQ